MFKPMIIGAFTGLLLGWLVTGRIVATFAAHDHGAPPAAPPTTNGACLHGRMDQ
jgi:hypothetical protein